MTIDKRQEGEVKLKAMDAHETVREFYDQKASEYDGHFLRRIDKAENAWTFSRIDRMLGRADRVLDLGCGTGLLLEHIRIEDYTGIDISFEMIERAQRKFPHRSFDFQVSDVMEYIAPRGHYDAVLSTFGSLSYAVAGFDLLPGKIAAWLAPGGRIFLQFLGRKYQEREHHIAAAERLPIHPTTEMELRDLYGPYFRDLAVIGLNRWGDTIPYRWYLELESMTIGQGDPDGSYFLVLTGRRR